MRGEAPLPPAILVGFRGMEPQEARRVYEDLILRGVEDDSAHEG